MSSIDVELHVENLLADCSILSTEETGAYTLLLFYWLEYGVMLLDDACRISRVPAARWPQTWHAIEHFFDAGRVADVDHEGYAETKITLTPNRIESYLKAIDLE